MFGAFGAAISAGLARFAITTAEDHPGPATGMPIWALGVSAATGLPPYERFFAVMALPFRRPG